MRPARQYSRLPVALGWMFIAIWFFSAGLWMYYDATRPHQPRAETGNVYELNTHRSVSYLTFADCVRLYGAMALGGGGILSLFAVDLWRHGWTAP